MGYWPLVSGVTVTEVDTVDAGRVSAQREGLDLSEASGTSYPSVSEIVE